jgi:VIT1/CCC1 family predicted Fe2+/Mn2+ transporter
MVHRHIPSFSGGYAMESSELEADAEAVLMRARPKKVFSFIGETLSMGDRLSELLYGVLMVSSISGLVELAGPKEDAGFQYMLVVLFTTIILWGILDGISYAMLSAAARAERETLVEELAAEGDESKRKAKIASELDGTLVSRLDKGSMSRIVDIVDGGLPANNERMTINRLNSNEKSVILAAFILDFSALLILVLPYFIFNRLGLAAVVSHTIALVMFIVLGYYYAKFAHLNRWKGAFVCGLMGLLLLIFAEVTNLVLI